MQMIKRMFRMWPAWVVSLCMFMLVYALAPQQISNVVFKVMCITVGAIVGYWVHVWGFGHIGEEMEHAVLQHSKWRRTAFMIGGMIAFSLAV